MSYIVINKMTAKAGKRDELIQTLLEISKSYEANESCELYLVSRDKNNETAIWVQGIWKDNKSFEEARNSEFIKVYIQKALPLLDGMHQQIEIEAAGGKHPFKLN